MSENNKNKRERTTLRRGHITMKMKRWSIVLAVLFISIGFTRMVWAGDTATTVDVKQPSFVREWASDFDSTHLSFHTKLGWGDAVFGATHLWWAAWKNSEGMIYVQFSEILTAKMVMDLNTVRDTIGRPWFADHVSVETSNEPTFASRSPVVKNERCLAYVVDRIKRFAWCTSMNVIQTFPTPVTK